MVITDHVSIECRNNNLTRQNQHEKHKHLLCCAECLTGHGLHPFQKSTTWLCNALTSRVTPSKDFTGQERAAHKQTNQMELDFLLVGKVHWGSWQLLLFFRAVLKLFLNGKAKPASSRH